MKQPRSQLRARYARTTGDLTINQNPSYVGTYPGMTYLPVPFQGENVWESDSMPLWWQGSDNPLHLPHIGPNGERMIPPNMLAVVNRATNLLVDPMVNSRWHIISAADTIDESRTFASTTRCRAGFVTRCSFGTTPGSLSPRSRLHGNSTSTVFWGEWIRRALWWGMGAFIFVEDAQGLPVPGAMRLINPFMLSANKDGTWRIG